MSRVRKGERMMTAGQIPEGGLFRKRTGEYLFKRLSAGTIRAWRLDPDFVYGANHSIRYNGNGVKLPFTHVVVAVSSKVVDVAKKRDEWWHKIFSSGYDESHIAKGPRPLTPRFDLSNGAFKDLATELGLIPAALSSDGGIIAYYRSLGGTNRADTDARFRAKMDECGWKLAGKQKVWTNPEAPGVFVRRGFRPSVLIVVGAGKGSEDGSGDREYPEDID
jgi:hypothetical protein